MSFDWLNPEERAGLLDFLSERFGIASEIFENHSLFRKGDYINVVCNAAVEVADALDGLDAGLQLVKLTRSGGFKPVTRGIQVFGAGACRNVIELDGDDIRSIIEGRLVEAGGLKGFVILKYKGHVLGVGLCREGRLEGQLPRTMTNDLVFSSRCETV